MLMSQKNTKALNEDILNRFLIDTFDEITTNATVERILEDAKKDKSDLKLFESRELTLRFINSCKRNILNWEMMSLSLLDDTIHLNDVVCHSKVAPAHRERQLPHTRHLLRPELPAAPRSQESRRVRLLAQVHHRPHERNRQRQVHRRNRHAAAQQSGYSPAHQSASTPSPETSGKARATNRPLSTKKQYPRLTQFYRGRGEENIPQDANREMVEELDRLDDLEALVQLSNKNEEKIATDLELFTTTKEVFKKISLPKTLNFEHFDIS